MEGRDVVGVRLGTFEDMTVGGTDVVGEDDVVHGGNVATVDEAVVVVVVVVLSNIVGA